VPKSAEGVQAVAFESPAAWESWLAAHHASAQLLWLRIAKKGHAPPGVFYDDALDVALCYGWIDGQRKASDSVSFLQRYTPRRPQSHWSARNVGKALALQAARRMQPAGLAQITAALADGRWQGKISA
jgi:uncharacterized protein YdeI (YjbR/CyaY-like superfamily)